MDQYKYSYKNGWNRAIRGLRSGWFSLDATAHQCTDTIRLMRYSIHFDKYTLLYAQIHFKILKNTFTNLENTFATVQYLHRYNTTNAIQQHKSSWWYGYHCNTMMIRLSWNCNCSKLTDHHLTMLCNLGRCLLPSLETFGSHLFNLLVPE